MKLPEFTKRDVKAFFFGVLFLLILDLIFDWNGSIQAFKDGYNEVRGENVK
jgi:hypothetical protein